MRLSTSAKERQAQLETEQERLRLAQQSELAELAREADAVRTRTRAASDSIEIECARLRDKLAAEIAASFLKDSAGLAQQWIKNPTRAIAVELAQVFARHDKRAHEQLGTQLRATLVAHALADAIIRVQPSAVNAFGREDWNAGSSVDGSQATAAAERFRAAVNLGAAPSIQQATEHLELVLTAAAARTSGEPDATMQRRYQAKRGAATTADEMTAGARVRQAEIDESRRVA
jgi:hypothetical protein